MITPRRTRLIRVDGLQAFRESILKRSSEAPAADAVLVPTRSAGLQLARMFEARNRAAPAIFTRDELYDDLCARLDGRPLRLNAFDRDAIAQAAALNASAEGPPLSFRIRPALVAEMMRFYDHLCRQRQPVERFEELMEEKLSGDAPTDRGAERMLRQTRFLAATFHEYERALLRIGASDEHSLRARLIDQAAASPLRGVIVTVGDWIADPDGLFAADFDLLSRIPGLERLDVVSTAEVLRSGFHERIHQWLPGIEEVREESERPGAPLLLVPDEVDADRPWFVHRDREEELLDVGRYFRAISSTPSRCAVVFKRPLPYLYLAPDTLTSAGMSYQYFDAFPLAAEPAIAALDLVLGAVEANFTREALISLLESPYLAKPAGVSRDSVAALNRGLSEIRFLGDLSRLEDLKERLAKDHPASLPAYEAALAMGRDLLPLAGLASASVQIDRLLAFLQGHAPVRDIGDPFRAREERARTALVQLLERLGSAHAGHHDPPWAIDDLAPAVRRWIQEETFAGEETSRDGVHLLDDRAARYGDFEHVAIVGLVENDWPERPRRNIFYPPALHGALGWPSEKDRRAGADARFLDLIRSASRTVRLSTFALDDEMLVNQSLQLDEVSQQAGLQPGVPLAVSAATHCEPADAATPWLHIRQHRIAPESPEFHGAAGRQPPRTWPISALETYLACPFKFFAQYVLRLAEEPDDEEVMDPRREGQLLHAVFEAFFRAWQKSGRGAITIENVEEAREMFAAIVDDALRALPEAEAGVQRTRLLGSPAAAGLGEAVFRMEAERPTPVVERLLEYPLKGEFQIATAAGPRMVPLSGKADRLDLLADGTFRLIDYKLGWPPDRGRALQLPVYSLCASIQLQRERRRPWALGEAVYIAFKGPRRVVPLFSNAAARDEVLAGAQQRLADALDAIEAGRFPPTPDDVFRCETCAFTAVCRKDYVGE